MKGYRLAKDLVNTELYRLIVQNDVDAVNKLIAATEDQATFRYLTEDGETYLHLAVRLTCSPDIIEALVWIVRIGQKDKNYKTALDLVIESNNRNTSTIIQHHLDFITHCLKDGEFSVIFELVVDGWSYWPVKGIPEITQFDEAVDYLTAKDLSITIHPCLPGGILRRLHVLSLAQTLISTGCKSLQRQKDILGMNLLHKTVINKDFEVFFDLLKFEEMVSSQDNLGRTPLHYAGAFGEDSLVWIHIQDAKDVIKKCAFEVVDNKGFTAFDYAKGRSKIDLSKLRDFFKGIWKPMLHSRLITAIIDEQNDYFGSNLDVNSESLSDIFFNSQQKPCVDAFGRNFLHIYTILQDHCDVEFMVNLDPDFMLLKDTDAWGRTPLHYAGMFGHENVLRIFAGKWNRQAEQTKRIMSMKDVDGKTCNDYFLENGEKTSDEMRKRQQLLSKTIRLLSIVPQLKQCQHAIIQMLLQGARAANHMTDIEPDKNDEQYIWTSVQHLLDKVFGEHDRGKLKILMAMQTPTGIPLGYYLFLNEFEELLELPWYTRIATDNMGRNPFHFMSYIPKDSHIRDNLEDDEDSEVSDIEYDFNQPESEDNSDSTKSFKYNVKKYLAIPPGSRKDLKGMTPEDYAKEANPFGKLDDIWNELNNAVKNQSVAKCVRNGKIEINSKSKSKREISQTAKPNYSATVKRPPIQDSVQFTPHDSEYLKNNLGETLTVAMAILGLLKPADPIEFLANFLYKHAENVSYQKQKKEIEEKTNSERKLHDEILQTEELLRQEQIAMEDLISEGSGSTLSLSDVTEESEGDDENKTKPQKPRKYRFERQLSGISFRF